MGSEQCAYGLAQPPITQLVSTSYHLLGPRFSSSSSVSTMASSALMTSQRLTPPPMPTDRHRLSVLSVVSSSATSFQTAPMTPSSSVQTIIPHETSPVDPMQGISQEVHVVQVTDDTVTLQKSMVAESYFPRYTAGPLPPSPPASIDNEISPKDELVVEEVLEEGQIIQIEPLRQSEETQPRLQRASTDTRASTRTIQISKASPPSSFPVASSSKAGTHLSSDTYLQPPPGPIHRPTRRNTTGSAAKQYLSISTALPVTGELESDIQLHADNIRRERISKRAMLQQEAEAALTREKTMEKDKENLQDEPIVGKWIEEDHVNYVLMYNMLTGIRIGVSDFTFCLYPFSLSHFL